MILDVLDKPGFVAEKIRYKKGCDKPYLSLETQYNQHTLEMSEAINAQNYTRVIRDIKEDVAAKMPNLEKRVHREMRNDTLDENTSTTIGKPMELGASYEYFENAIRRVFPRTGGNATLVEGRTAEKSFNESSLLSDSRKEDWSGILKMPCTQQLLPSGNQPISGLAE